MIRKAKTEDLFPLTDLALKLWPGHDREELAQEMKMLLDKPDAALFLAYFREDAVGFAQCQLRQDYVEGTETSPVGYLEGIFVAPEHRRQGVARRLLAACKDWARQCGCQEFGSDCELENTQSLHFHLALGFQEAGRIICFTSKL